MENNNSENIFIDKEISKIVRLTIGEMGANPVVFRCPKDVVALNRHRLINGGAFLLIAVLCGLNYYQSLRQPDLITAIVDESGRRVISINNREYGATEAVVLGKDNLNKEDKKQLISEFFGINTINQQSRESDINRALKCLLPNLRDKFLKEELVESGQLANEKQQMWASNWEIQNLEIKVFLKNYLCKGDNL